METLLQQFAQARKELQEAQAAWKNRERQKGPWLPLLDRYRAAEKEEQRVVDEILSGTYS